MKKLIALLLALAMFCVLVPAMADEGLTGEWYGTMYGAAVTMTFNDDGTYTMAVAGQSQGGTYELRDGIVYMDGVDDPAQGFVFDGTSLVNEQYGVTFTRENNVQDIVIADPNPEAPVEAFSGEWVCRYLSMSGVTLDIQQMPEEMLAELGSIPGMTIDGTSVTINGAGIETLTGEAAIEMTYADGALTVDKDGVTIQVQMLQDGMTALTISMYGMEYITLWFEPAV